jgi:hypothetical protein
MPLTRQLKKLDQAFRIRLRETISKYVTVFAIGSSYLLVVLYTGWGIPCPVYAVTGLQCPACGVSRMILALLRMDFVTAWRMNPYLLLNAPIILVSLLATDIRFVRTGEGMHGAVKILLWIELAMALSFGVLRNVCWKIL